jgi:hypothetical protein
MRPKNERRENPAVGVASAVVAVVEEMVEAGVASVAVAVVEETAAAGVAVEETGAEAAGHAVGEELTGS